MSIQMSNSSNYRLLIHAGVILLMSFGISAIFPMFFRSDDVLLIHWGASRDIYDIFNINNERLVGIYRPVYHYLFSAGYSVFGLDPFGYQVVSTAIFILQFYLLYHLCSVYFDRSTAAVVLISYCVLFYSTFQMAFWFTDVCFSMHVMFALLSMIFYLKSKVNIYYIALSYLFALMGALTKEPAIVIVSAFVFADLLTRTPRDDYAKRVFIFLPYIVIAIWLLVVSGAMDTRFKHSTDAASVLDKLDYRFRYYFTFLLSGTKNIIPWLLSVSLAFSISRPLWLRAGAVLLALPCYFSPYYYIAFLLLVSSWFVTREWKLLPFFFWMLLTSLTLPFMAFITPTYLYEFTFGFSVLFGWIVNSYLVKQANLHFITTKQKKIAASAALLVLGSVLAVKPIAYQVEALRLVVENRSNLAKGIDFIDKSKDSIDYLVVMDHENFDSPEKLSKWAIMSNKDKAKSDKVMSAENIAQYLDLLGINHIKVIPYSKYAKNPIVGPKVVLLLQNDADISFSNENRLMGKELFTYTHHSTNRLLVASLK